MSQIKSQQITVTPQLAQHFLSLNISNNRNIREGVVNKYATAMRNGNWELSDPLKFDVNGNLIDGQHRLSAVIKANTPVPFVVCTDYPPESAHYLDIGAKRNVADIASLMGQTVKNYELAIARALLFSEGDYVSGRNPVSEKNIIDIYNKYEPYVKFGAELHKNKKVYMACVAAVFARALYYYQVRYPDAEKLARLKVAMTLMISGVSNMIDNPLLLLRDHIMVSKSTSTRDRVTKIRLADYLLNLFMNKRQRKKATVPKTYEILYTLPEATELCK